MSNKQNLKFLLKPSIMVGLLYCLWLVTANSENLAMKNDSSGTQGKISIPVVANQLDTLDAVIPVELKCDEAVSVYPDTLDQIPCTLRNNSDKVIAALVLNTSVDIDSNGKVSKESAYTTMDTFVHADLHAGPKNPGLKQYAEPPFPSARQSFDGIIKKIQVHIDYVEFTDKSTLGLNRKGSEMVAGIRNGAAKYKEWLVEKLETTGKSADDLAALLGEDSALPIELGFKTGTEEQGAVIYRNHLRKMNRTEGLEQLMKRWNQGNSTQLR